MMFLCLFCMIQAKAQINNFKFGLQSTQGYSGFYSSNEDDIYNNYYSYKYGWVTNFYFKKAYSTETGFFINRYSIFYKFIVYSDANKLISEEIKYYGHYDYIEVPFSFYKYFANEKLVSPFLKIGVSNLFLFKLISEVENVPETINGHPSYFFYQNYPIITSGFKNIKNTTALKKYNLTFNTDIGLRFKIGNRFYCKTSLNFNSNVFTVFKKNDGFDRRKFYFIGLNLTFEI